MLLLGALALLPQCICLNILLFLLGTNQNERHTFEFLAQQLALRHHQVTTVKPILIPEEPRLVKPKLHLVKEKTLKNLISKELVDELEKTGDVVPWQEGYVEDTHGEAYWKAHNASCYKMINSNLLDTLKSDNIDVAILYSGNLCQLALCHVLGIPFIYFDLEGLSDETLVSSNTPLNLNVPPSRCFLPEVTNPMLRRIRNGICYMREYVVQADIPFVPGLLSEKFEKLDSPIINMFSEDYYLKKKIPSFPSASALLRSSSIFFANTDPLLEYPRALSPRVIPVGGLHIDIPKPLFAPWNTSIESAKDGLIVVSLGTQVNHAQMTTSQVKAILGVLSKLNSYRIYWRIGHQIKLNGVEEQDVPSHINLTAYFPQNDLLAHKSCKLLVTNGGMSSLMEAVAHGVPIVGIPLYGSNRHNLKKVVNKGLGMVVRKDLLNEENLLKVMKTVLRDPKYSMVAKEMSREFRSRSSSPFSTALHFIEFVGRHRGAAFFSDRATHPFVALNLDFLFILFSFLFLTFYCISLLIRAVFCRRAGMSPAISPNKGSKSYSKKND
ncbi:unnamed protein product [Nippostrongylus brasiliensis]|uniref:glucuronosyltransferase n=1 Tax=Nippostrongylus brasiliensis TaxID=27835 RepID=A0A0N4XW91_NIPBR|nr:unnamed protein product [Nippostrongylus brasiliensis]